MNIANQFASYRGQTLPEGPPEDMDIDFIVEDTPAITPEVQTEIPSMQALPPVPAEYKAELKECRAGRERMKPTDELKKLALLYWQESVRQNPNALLAHIVKALELDRSALLRWRKEAGTDTTKRGPRKKVGRPKGSKVKKMKPVETVTLSAQKAARRSVVSTEPVVQKNLNELKLTMLPNGRVLVELDRDQFLRLIEIL